jgi:hypothetical protein
MNINQTNARARFWLWIVVALVLGGMMGFIVGVGTIIVLLALTDYVTPTG